MHFDKPQVIVFANQKGGCGKTSSAVHVAAALSLEGYRTCLVDVDGQCNASMAVGVDPEMLRREKIPSVLDIYLNRRPGSEIAMPVGGEFYGNNLFLIPGHPAVGAVHMNLEAKMKSEVLTEGYSPEDEDDLRKNHRDRLARSFDSFAGKMDFIVIDTPPDLGFLLSTALRSGDYFVIPLFPSEFEVRGMERLIATANKIKHRVNPRLRLLRVLMGAFDNTASLDKQLRESLKDQFGEFMSDTVITRGVRMREVASHGKPIFEHAPSSEQAQQFRAFTKELETTILAGMEKAPASTSDTAAGSGGVLAEAPANQPLESEGVANG